MRLDQVRVSTTLIVLVFDTEESRNVSRGVKTVQISFYCHRRAQSPQTRAKKGGLGHLIIIRIRSEDKNLL